MKRLLSLGFAVCLSFNPYCNDTLSLETIAQTSIPKKIVISQNERVLYFYDQDTIYRFQVAFGLNSGDDKERQGDYATPRGDYIICDKHVSEKFQKFLLLNYPNAKDAERGLRLGLINESQYREIVEAAQNRSCPPMNTRLGGHIGIHGEKKLLGGLVSLGSEFDWTKGCVAMDQEDIEILYTKVPIGTQVKIK